MLNDLQNVPGRSPLVSLWLLKPRCARSAARERNFHQICGGQDETRRGRLKANSCLLHTHTQAQTGVPDCGHNQTHALKAGRWHQWCVDVPNMHHRATGADGVRHTEILPRISGLTKWDRRRKRMGECSRMGGDSHLHTCVNHFGLAPCAYCISPICYVCAEFCAR